MVAFIVLSLAISWHEAPPTKSIVAPIASTPVGESGPTVEVPAALARLTSPDTIAVMYVPQAVAADHVIMRLGAVVGSMEAMLPLGMSMKQILKQSVRTDLEIPLNQPVLWWVDMPMSEEDEPPMGMAEIVFHQAFRIPGAMAAMDKARAAAVNADGTKKKVVMPIRARNRSGSISVLTDDLVVISSDMEPFESTPDQAGSPLLQRLPLSVIAGRIDLSRVMAEQGDQLKMLGAFATLGWMGESPSDADNMSAEQKHALQMRRVVGEAVGQQVNHAVDGLMGWKRAGFAVALQGDDLSVWIDWSCSTTNPEGMSASTVQTLAALLPRGHSTYFGASSHAMRFHLNERCTLDDVLATVGSSPEQAAAYAQAITLATAVLDQVPGGMVGGSCLNGGRPVSRVAFQVRDAAIFRRDVIKLFECVDKAGLASISTAETEHGVNAIVRPSVQRIGIIMSSLGVEATSEAAEEAMENAVKPCTLSFRLNGNAVVLTASEETAAVENSPVSQADAADMRGELGANSWGTADWFCVTDLRELMSAGWESTSSAIHLPDGAPVMLRVWQGVQGNTTRLTAQFNLASLQKLLSDFMAIAENTADDAGEDDALDKPN